MSPMAKVRLIGAMLGDLREPVPCDSHGLGDLREPVPCDSHGLAEGDARLGAYGFSRASSSTTASASATCFSTRSCEENACRTFPVRSTTKVARPGMMPSVDFTPHRARTLPPSSLRSVMGSLCLLANWSCESSESELMPTTSAPAAANESYRSRKVHASTVQPGVSSFG